MLRRVAAAVGRGAKFAPYMGSNIKSNTNNARTLFSSHGGERSEADNKQNKQEAKPVSLTDLLSFDSADTVSDGKKKKSDDLSRMMTQVSSVQGSRGREEDKRSNSGAGFGNRKKNNQNRRGGPRLDSVKPFSFDKGPGMGLFADAEPSQKRTDPAAAKSEVSNHPSTDDTVLRDLGNDGAAMRAGLDAPGSVDHRVAAHTNFDAQTAMLEGKEPWKKYMAGLATTAMAQSPYISPEDKQEIVQIMAEKLDSLKL